MGKHKVRRTVVEVWETEWEIEAQNEEQAKGALQERLRCQEEGEVSIDSGETDETCHWSYKGALRSGDGNDVGVKLNEEALGRLQVIAEMIDQAE